MNSGMNSAGGTGSAASSSPWKVVFLSAGGYLVGLGVGVVVFFYLSLAVMNKIVRSLFPEHPDMGIMDVQFDYFWPVWVVPLLAVTTAVITGTFFDRRSSPSGINTEILAAGQWLLRKCVLFQIINAFVGFVGIGLLFWVVLTTTLYVVGRELRFGIVSQILLNVVAVLISFPEWTMLVADSRFPDASGLGFMQPTVLVTKVITAVVACLSWHFLSNFRAPVGVGGGNRQPVGAWELEQKGVSDSYFYVGADNEPIGPISSEVLLQLRRSGTVTDETFIASEGEADWAALGDRLGELESSTTS